MNARDAWQQSETTMKKILIIESMDINFSESFEVKIPYDSQHRELDLGYSLHHILHHSNPQSIKNFSIMQNIRSSIFIPPNNFFNSLEPILSNIPSFQDRILQLLKKSPSEFDVFPLNNHTLSKLSNRLRRKRKEFLIEPSEWRELSQKNQKITLEEGAKIIGIPKKTLDDYYAHLKLGTEYNFDFKQNLEQKIGVLRSFVREKNSKKKQGTQFQFLEDMIKSEEVFDSDEEQQQE